MPRPTPRLAPLRAPRSASSRRLLSNAAFVALGLLVVLITPGCSSSDEQKGYIDSDLAFEYRSSAELGVLQPRWHLVRVARRLEEPTRLVHVVQVPPEDAGQLMMLSDRERARKIAEVACPKADDPIWQSLSRGHDIEVDMESDNGLFETVGCRSQVF